MVYDVVALICALGQDPVECQPPTALRQIYLGHVTNEIMCAIEGQQHLAQAATMVPVGYYSKVVCLRHEDEAL